MTAGGWYAVRPLLEPWPNPTPGDERRSRYTFKSTFVQTLDLLVREINHLDGGHVVMHVAVAEGDIRRDGQLRADARPWHPGVRITFESDRVGSLSYGTDVCALWQHNVRSIALGLEALRAVDRYGITTNAEQYTGFKAIEARGTSRMTEAEAAELLERLSIGEEPGTPGYTIAIASIIRRGEDARRAFRYARADAHPDRRGGDRTMWDQVEQAGLVLGLVS